LDYIETEMMRCDIISSQDLTPSKTRNVASKNTETSNSLKLLDEISEPVFDEINTFNEYHDYLKERFEPKNTDVLKFWKNKKDTFPNLTSIARIAFAVPATSAGVERLFSIAGSLGRARRSRLKVEVVENLILKRENE